MQEFLFSPIYSFYHRDFYRRVIQSKLGRSLLYLAYLTLLSTLMLLITLMSFAPKADQFVGWLKSEFPPLIWTQEGLRLRGGESYTIIHPEWGPLAVFDTRIKEISSSEEMGGAFVFVTAQKLYLKKNPDSLQVYDLRSLMEQKGQEPRYGQEIRGDWIESVYRSIKFLILFSIPLFLYPFLYVLYLVEAIFYSWFGLIFNFGRSSKLSYGQIFNLTVYAMTPAIFILYLHPIFPVLNKVPFGFPGSLLITFIYLYFAVKRTETRLEDLTRDSSEIKPPGAS